MHGMQLSVEFTSVDGSLKLRASGSQVVFAGYLKAFEDFDTGKEGSSGKHTAFGLACRSAFEAATGSAFGWSIESAIVMTSTFCLNLMPRMIGCRGAHVFNSLVCRIGFKSFDMILSWPTAQPPFCHAVPHSWRTYKLLFMTLKSEMAPLLHKLAKFMIQQLL